MEIYNPRSTLGVKYQGSLSLVQAIIYYNTKILIKGVSEGSYNKLRRQLTLVFGNINKINSRNEFVCTLRYKNVQDIVEKYKQLQSEL